LGFNCLVQVIFGHDMLRFEALATLKGNRKQMLLRAVDADRLIETEHPRRSIWELVGRLNLDFFHSRIRSVKGCAGRSALDPHLLISLGHMFTAAAWIGSGNCPSE
jgi:hypothetical protein